MANACRQASAAYREGRIVENHLDESIDPRAQLDRRPTDVDEFRRRFSHHAHADQLSRIGVDNQPVEVFGVPRELYARVVAVERFARHLVDAALLAALFGHADGADFGAQSNFTRR